MSVLKREMRGCIEAVVNYVNMYLKYCSQFSFKHTPQQHSRWKLLI